MSTLLLKTPAQACAGCGDTKCIADLYSQGIAHYVDDNGDPQCDDCHERDRREETFDCCRCQEDGEQDIQHRFIVLFDPEDAGSDLKSGVYAVTQTPYYVSYMIGGHLYDWCLSRIMDVDPDWESFGYAGGATFVRAAKCSSAWFLDTETFTERNRSMKPSFEEAMAGAAEIGRQQVARGRAQLQELRKDPVKNAAKIKFLELAVGNEEKALEACDMVSNGNT